MTPRARWMLGLPERVIRRVGAMLVPVRVGIRTRDPDLMRRGLAMQVLSRKCFGWLTPRRTRWWEYPWAVREVERYYAGQAWTALDAGSGKSPVAVALARLGFRTTTADPDSQTHSRRRFGGEWDWTDYGRWGIESRKAGLEEPLFEPASLGVAVSISVIEHLPTKVRRTGLHRFSSALEPGGLCVLTVDCFRGSRRLWNRMLSKEVEPVELHGAVDDLIAEARAERLDLIHEMACPVTKATLDVVGLTFRKEAG